MIATEAVRNAARKLDLLTPDGRLQELDSLAVIDLVLELEATTRIQIPTASLRQDYFESIETVAAMLEELGLANR